MNIQQENYFTLKFEQRKKENENSIYYLENILKTIEVSENFSNLVTRLLNLSDETRESLISEILKFIENKEVNDCN